MKKIAVHQFVVVAVLVSNLDVSDGHGRLVFPASRASMWRYGFNNPPDYNDNEGFCGGFMVQWGQNGGKCGVCGDNWADPTPRAHEAGGRYGNGIITATFLPRQIVSVKVELTANHKGYFTFRLCPAPSKYQDPSQSCLDSNPLEISGTGGSRYNLPSYSPGTFSVPVVMPSTECAQCILQWTYTAGNNWGVCADGTGALGCGNQEHFRACADIRISSSGGGPITAGTPTTTARTTAPLITTTTTARTEAPWTTARPSGGCAAIGVWAGNPGMHTWCTTNCNHVPSYCPASMCKC